MGISDVAGSPAAGVENPGTSYTLNAGTYAVSENIFSGYTQSISGDCDTSGSVVLGSGDNKICTITNDDIAPPSVVPPTVVPPVVPPPVVPPTVVPPTSTPPTVVPPTVTPPTPGLPKTGLPPQENILLNSSIFSSLLVLVLTSLIIARRKRAISSINKD